MTGHTTQPPRRAGHKHPSLAPAAALFLGSALAAVAAGGVDLTLADPSPDAPPPLADTATVTPAADATWLVHGRLSGAGFAVARPGQVRVTDGAGEPLPLVVETNTLFREFGEIVALTAAFEIDPRTLAAGPPRIEWGPDVAGEVRPVATITFPPDAGARIRVFAAGDSAAPPSGDASHFATIDIIADSHADSYYLWYLLPMAVIFALLIIRKRWTT